MTRPKAVVFDIGNVLIEWQPERFFDRIMSTEDRDRMFATVDLHAMNDQIDRGGEFQAIVYQTADETPEFQGQIRLWHDNWLDLASPAIERSVSLHRALQACGIETYILSNIGRETYLMAEGRYPFLAEFDRHYVSAHMATIKPEAQIYELVEKDCGLAPDQLLFTDDRLDNIDAARSRGWQVHHFTGSKGWAEALVAHELLTPEAAGLEET